LKQIGVGPNDFGRSVVQLVRSFYAAIALLSLIYQGGMALHYHRQRAIVQQALEQAAARAGSGPRPPSLPGKILARVLRVATMEGWSVLVLGTLSALLSAASRGWFGAVVGSLVAGCGAVEVHGTALLRAGQARGTSWLVRSQLLLLAVILLYALINILMLTSHQFEALLAQLPPESRSEYNRAAELFGYTPAAFSDLLLKSGRIFYAMLAALTLLYQGGMALYYHRRRTAVHQALESAGSGNPTG
jgi:hypothetical protein